MTEFVCIVCEAQHRKAKHECTTLCNHQHRDICMRCINLSMKSFEVQFVIEPKRKLRIEDDGA